MQDDISTIRRQIADLDRRSASSETFQDDLIRFGREFAQRGNCLIEVGCYHGGMTAQFAALACELGQKVHVVDIDSHYLSVARDTVERLSLSDYAVFHQMNFQTFAETAESGCHAILVLIDGDHFYNGVVADIRALYSFRHLPYAAAFHDYSLRYANPEGADIRVDRALHDILGIDFKRVPIGELSREGGTLRTAPGDDHHFHELGQYEGVMIKLGENEVRPS